MTSMGISEGRGNGGAEAVPGNDEVGRAVAGRGGDKGGLIWKILVTYPDWCEPPVNSW